MNIITEWLAGLPNMPACDEFGRPWANISRYGMTPCQQAFFQAIQGEPIAAHIGVVDDTHLYQLQSGKLARRALGEIRHAGDLLEICLQTELETVWILSGTALSDRATEDFITGAGETWEVTNAQYAQGETQTDGQARASFLRAYKKREARGRRSPGETDQGRAVYLAFAEHSFSYNFDEIRNATTLLYAVAYLEDAIAAPLRFSAQTVGKNLMKAENSAPARLSWVAPIDLSAFPQVESAATDLVWMRELTPDEYNGYLITADKNSMYCAACTSAQLGEGEPVYKRGTEIDASRLQTGIYHIRLSGASQWDGVQLPHPTDRQVDLWAWVYTVKLCQDLGYGVEIVEGVVWERAHTTLRTWAERVWRSRAGLKRDKKRYQNEAGRLASNEAMQTIIRGAMGLLAHKPEFADRQGALDWFRPDWNRLIVDLSRVKMFYTIRKYVELGYKPFAVLTDCIYFIGVCDNHPQAIPGLFDRAGELGGFKRKFDRAVTGRQIAALQARKGYTITEVNIALIKFDRDEIEIEEAA